MNAKVTYNSYLGTAAADLHKSINLKKLLISSGHNGNRFEPLGLDVNLNSGIFSISIICIDKLNSETNKNNIVKCQLKSLDFININTLFDNLNISVISNHLSPINYNSSEIKIFHGIDDIDE